MLVRLSTSIFLFFFFLSDHVSQDKNVTELYPPFQSFPCKDQDVPRYTAQRAKTAPVIDGKLDEAIWRDAARSTRFVDLVHGTTAHLDTRAAVLWDDEYLYVAYWLQEPNVEATLTERD